MYFLISAKNDNWEIFDLVKTELVNRIVYTRGAVIRELRLYTKGIWRSTGYNTNKLLTN